MLLFNKLLLVFVVSHENELVCWATTNTAKEEVTSTNNATHTPKASDTSASRSW